MPRKKRTPPPQEPPRKRRFEALLEAPADPRLVAFYRIVYGLILFVFAITSIRFVPLLWFAHPYLKPGLMYWVHGLWVVVAFLVLVGFGGRITVLVNTLLVLVIFHFESTGMNVEEMLTTIASVWLTLQPSTGYYSVDAWLRRRRGDTRPIPSPVAWPIYGLAVNIGLTFFVAGLRKVLDPIWVDGYGFYYVYLLPWFKLPAFDFLANSKALMLFMNYGTFPYELLFIPTFLWKRSRPVAVLVSAGFFAFISWPVQMGYIGWMGLSSAFAYIAITPSLGKRALRFGEWFASKVLRRSPGGGGRVPMLPGLERGPWGIRARNVYLVIVTTLFALVVVDALIEVTHRGFPIVHPPMRLAYADPANPDSLTLAPPQMPVEVRPGPLMSLVPRWVYDLTFDVFKVSSWTTIFNHSHFLGHFEYRFIFDLDDGRKVEPFSIFTPDMEPGPDTKGLNPRWLQTTMYAVRSWVLAVEGKQHYGKPIDESDLSDYGYIFDALTHFGLSEMPETEREHAVGVTLTVVPILMPEQYEGDVKLWKKLSWTPVYHRDLRTGERTIPDVPPMPEQRVRVPSCGPNAYLVVDYDFPE